MGASHRSETEPGTATAFDVDAARARLAEGLGDLAWTGSAISVRASTASTNEDALAAATGGAPHGALFVADTQTKGRGRRGASWSSPPGVGLYLSVVLRPDAPLERPAPVVAAAGLAVAEGVASACGIALDIKWPNDLWHRGRKVAGVLVEARGFDPRRPALVVGVGVNVNTLPADLPSLPASAGAAGPASLAMIAGRRLDRLAVAVHVLRAFERRVGDALRGELAELARLYRERSCLRGAEVTLLDGDEPLRGHVEDVSATEGLLLRLADGTRRHVRAEHAREVRPA